MLSGIDGIHSSTAAFDLAAHRIAVASTDLYGDEPSERTGPVGPFGTGNDDAVRRPATVEAEALPTPARGLHGPDLLNEMLTMMIAHAQLPAVIRGIQAGSEMHRSLVDLRA